MLKNTNEVYTMYQQINLFVRDIHVCVKLALYPLRWPFKIDQTN